MDEARAARAVREILIAIGEDPDREGLRETPKRVAEAYDHLFSGLREDPTRYLEGGFDEAARDLVLIRDVPVVSMCVPSKQMVNAVSGVKKAAEIAVGDELWTLDKGFLAKTTVTRTSSHKTHDVVCVRTSAGTIKVTADHPLKTENGWCEAGSLLPGDRVEWFPPKKLCRQAPAVVPGYQLGYLLGAVASEGSIQDERRISVVVGDQAFAERVATAWREAFSVEARIEHIMVDSGFLKRKIPMCRVRVVSSFAAEKIGKWLKIPRGCKDKTRGFRFPTVVTASQEMTQGFLNGYADGDGHRQKTSSRIVTANATFALELADYLQTPVGGARRGFFDIYVSDRWHQPGWVGKHGFRQQSGWYVPQDSDYAEVEIVSPTPASKRPHTVYSFGCEPHPTFLIGGHLTHNCEHHMLPLTGKAHVGYLPNGRVAGFSEIVRVVGGYARRPQIQERLTAQVADAMYDSLGSLGSIVVIEATHTCMTARVAETTGSMAATVAARGVFEEDASRRAEVMALISRGA